jgi:hypothetical protein
MFFALNVKFLLCQAVLQHVLHGLQDPVLASEAATALQSICTKCRSQMAQHFTGIGAGDTKSFCSVHSVQETVPVSGVQPLN